MLSESIELPCEFTQVAALDAVPLADATKPVMICGTAGNNSVTTVATWLAGITPLFEKGGLPHNLKLACLFPGPNSYAAALLTREHGAVSLEDALAKGGIKGIIAVEVDIPEHLLEGIQFVFALDWRATSAVQAAQIVFPTTSWVEMDGTCINNEGRAQRFKKVMNPGIPVKGLDPAGHPPHIHCSVPPGGEALPAWQVVAGIIEGLGGERITEPFSGKWEYLRELDAESEGIMINDL